MRLPTFYTAPDNISTENLILETSEAHHARLVMRLKKGSPLIVADGVGNAYRCEITSYGKKKAECRIFSRIRGYGEPACFVSLACGLSVGTKFADIIQRSTELGVSRIIPVLTEKSKVKLEEGRKVKSKLTRWKKVAVASMKQTGRSLIPDIWAPVKFGDMFGQYEEPVEKLMFDPTYGTSNMSKVELPSGAGHILLIVGPESGFSSEEIKAAKQNSVRLLTLGQRTLRAENAAPTVVALIMNTLGEFS